MSRDDKTHGPIFGGSIDLLLKRRGNPFIFIPFSYINLLISLHSIFQDEQSLGRKEEVEAAGLEYLDTAGLKDSSDDRGQDSKEDEDGEDNEEEGHEEGDEGHEEGAGLYDEGVGCG
jgi:hypothetical protein